MLDLYRVYMPAGLTRDVSGILYSGKVAFGRHAAGFEEKLKTYTGNELLCAVSSNNYALLIACRLLGLKEGDEVIASPVCCLASTQPLLIHRARVVWADIDPRTGTLDPADVRRKITGRTKAILHYHWCGYPGYIAEINKVGREHGVPVIEDASEAFGAVYRGKKIGNTGSGIVCFSFGPVRLPTTVSGGALTFASRKFFGMAALLRDYGIDRSAFRDLSGEISPDCDIAVAGYDAKLSEVGGLIGSAAAGAVDTLLERQARNAELLDTTVPPEKRIRVPPGVRPTYWVYTLFTGNPRAMLLALRERGIAASQVHLRNDGYSCFGNFRRCALPGVDDFTSRQLCIPCGWWLTSVDVRRLGDVIRQYRNIA